jgi:hypothetical protein
LELKQKKKNSTIMILSNPIRFNHRDFALCRNDFIKSNMIPSMQLIPIANRNLYMFDKNKIKLKRVNKGVKHVE